jgi:hypothetical protein
LKPENEGIISEPLGGRPIPTLGLSITQEYVVSFPEILICVEFVPSHKITSSIGLTLGVGLTVITN